MASRLIIRFSPHSLKTIIHWSFALVLIRSQREVLSMISHFCTNLSKISELSILERRIDKFDELHGLSHPLYKEGSSKDALA
jgi:hypothetical protein